MKHMKHFLFPLVLISLLTLCACSRNSPQPMPTPTPTSEPTPVVTPTPTPEPTPTPVPSPTADPVWGEQSFMHEYLAGGGDMVLDVTYRLPKVLNTQEYPAGEAINQWYEDEVASRVTEAEYLYELALSDYEICLEMGVPFQATTQEMTYEVTRCDDTVISVCREWYVNSGGPSPTVFRLSEQFDPVTGAKLGFADFFTDAEAVSDTAIDALAAAYGLERVAVAASFQPENFYFTDEGCVFWIQAGQIPALHSAAEATVSYVELEGWLRHG